jgi:hypothetical protein
MTFKPTLNKLNIVVILALLAALLLPVMGVAAGQTVAVHELFESDSADNAQTGVSAGTAIACGCGDPGGQSGGCC